MPAAGAILVAINPFKWITGLYTEQLMFQHLNLPSGEISTPHVYQIAAAAFKGYVGVAAVYDPIML